MANNRMYLKNTRTGQKVYLAKYYPSTGWYVVAEESLNDRLALAFDEADFGYLGPEERAAKRAQPKFGPPYSAGGMYGAEWAIEFEENGE